MEYRFCIEAEPITKKNSQRIVKAGGRYIVLPSKAYSEYEKQAIALLLLQKRPAAPIEYAVNVQEVFFLSTKRAKDLTNLEEACDDILVRAGILKDDNVNIIASHDGSRCVLDRHRPRTEITITRSDYDWTGGLP